jgi:Copper type II ascorbate-dependent monooxygenase, C-terminal domain
MRNRRKTVGGPAALGAALLLLAACGGGSPAPTQAQQPAPRAAATKAATTDPETHAGHASAGAPAKTLPLRAGERFMDLTMAEPYTPRPPNGGTDDYRCFIVDPKIAAPAFLTGSEFQPQNAEVVHHAIFFRVEPQDVAEAKALDNADAGPGYTCFGGSGVGGPEAEFRSAGGGGSADWVASWAPGIGEVLTPNKTGYLLQPGSQLIMQVHYNLLAVAGKQVPTDQSGIQLRLMDARSRTTPLLTRLLPAPVELACPAGVTGPLCNRDASVFDVIKRFGNHAGGTVAGLNLLCNDGRAPVASAAQSCTQPVRSAGTVYAVGGHMHLLGKSIKIELNPGTPEAKVLLDNENYNFDDQSGKTLPKPVAIKPGDTLKVTCTHDADRRAKLAQLKGVAPRYVVWGDGSSDEMCLGIVVWAKPGT